MALIKFGLERRVFFGGIGADKVWFGEYYWRELALIRFGLESIFSQELAMIRLCLKNC